MLERKAGGDGADGIREPASGKGRGCNIRRRSEVGLNLELEASDRGSRQLIVGRAERCNIRCESEVGRRCSQRMNLRRKPKVQTLSQPEKSESGASRKPTNWREPENAEPDESREQVLRGEPKHAMSDASRATSNGAARGAAVGASRKLNSVETRTCGLRRKPGPVVWREPEDAGSGASRNLGRW